MEIENMRKRQQQDQKADNSKTFINKWKVCSKNQMMTLSLNITLKGHNLVT